MGETIRVEGEEVPVNDDMTAEELVAMLDRDADELVTYEENGEIKVLGDRDNVLDNVPSDANVSFQPAEGQVFGIDLSGRNVPVEET